MKKLLLTTLAMGSMAFAYNLEDSLSIDTKVECNVAEKGIETVLATAKKYHKISKERGLEYRRLGVNNTDLIKAIEIRLETGDRVVKPLDFKGKKSKTILDIDFATERTCKFAINSLQNAAEGKKTWRNAVPGSETFIKN